jgi:hypothetical protein
MSRNLATSEMVKNSIISEIEENLSTQRQSIMQVSFFFLLFADFVPDHLYLPVNTAPQG